MKIMKPVLNNVFRSLILVCLTLVILPSCKEGKKHKSSSEKEQISFDVNSLQQDMTVIRELRGQLLYMPVYSNVPYQIDTMLFNMSAFVAIHNTDLSKNIMLTKVLYFDQDGNIVTDFLKKSPISINPLATKDFYIPYEDQSGTGANFLIEWVSDLPVSEPLIESVTLCLKPNNTLAVTSQGKVLKEKI